MCEPPDIPPAPKPTPRVPVIPQATATGPPARDPQVQAQDERSRLGTAALRIPLRTINSPS